MKYSDDDDDDDDGGGGGDDDDDDDGGGGGGGGGGVGGGGGGHCVDYACFVIQLVYVWYLMIHPEASNTVILSKSSKSTQPNRLIVKGSFV